jgi:glycerol-3-phosphate dehydrogenase subunit C
MENAGDVDPYSSEFKELIDLCYSCRRCVSVCPAGIPIPDVMSNARYAYLKRAQNSDLTIGHKIYSSYGTVDRLGSSFAPISTWLLRRRFVRNLMQLVTHIDSRALLPEFHRETFESWFEKQPRKPRGRKIVYFVDSFANYNEPSIGKLTVGLLKHAGYEVIVPPQRESGMPAIEYGMLDQARQVAKFNLQNLAPFHEKGLRIVCSSPAATFLLGGGYASILGNGELPDVSSAVVDLAELLLEEHENGAIMFKDKSATRIQYHYCCLSKALGMGPTTSKLLAEAGFQQTQLEECCGGAGVWGTFKENYEMSGEIASKLAAKVQPDGMLVTESETCKLQLEAHLKTKVRLPVELISERVQVNL